MSDVEWCQNCGDVVTDDGCACAAIPKPTGVLTREQLEASCREYERLLEQKRATIEQQAQELEGQAARIDALRTHLSATITERDELNIAVTLGIRHRQEYVERIDALVIELTASQARVKELEAQWHYAATHDADMDYVKEIAQLQATLAAREAELDRVKHFEQLSDENYSMYAMAVGQRAAAVQEAWRVKEECAKIAEHNTYMNPNADDGGNHGGPGSCEYGCGSVIAKAIRELK